MACGPYKPAGSDYKGNQKIVKFAICNFDFGKTLYDELTVVSLFRDDYDRPPLDSERFGFRTALIPDPWWPYSADHNKTLYDELGINNNWISEFDWNN